MMPVNVTQWLLFYFAFQSCQNSTQKKLPTDFKNFLANVPVLQWAKHFSELEYERLRQYYGAYGWGSVDFKGECNITIFQCQDSVLW